MAALIPGARAVQLAGDDTPPWSDDERPAEVERFLSGREEVTVPDSVLTTVLFTDIVGSTERAAELGDRAWRDLLARHPRRSARARPFRGEELDTAGDGFFATFDGPARAIRCAQAIVAGAVSWARVRAGLHTGECELHDGKPRESPSASARAWPTRPARVRCSLEHCERSRGGLGNRIEHLGSHALRAHQDRAQSDPQSSTLRVGGGARPSRG